jgi:hypothetical protein
VELYLQFGHAMMEHCRTLIRDWGGGTVILSPRDLTPEQVLRLSREINGLPAGRVLVDPQFFLPHADHERLCSHDYWPSEYSTNTFWGGTGLALLIDRLYHLNQAVESSAFIVPGMLAATIDDDWLEYQRATIEEARRAVSDRPVLSTVALSADAIRSQDQIHELLEECAEWPVDGWYLVCEHPSGEYLVTDPIWLANVLDLVAGLRLRSQSVILGYCTHQLLCAATAGTSAIAAGIWMNVRSFPPDKFRATYEDEIKQRSTWYYCPQALSEYKIPFLDIAHRQGVLGSMAPDPALGSAYADTLFSGPQPSTIGLSEQAAFRHYLHCLHSQTAAATQSSFDGTVTLSESSLTAAENLLARLRSAGVSGQLRDFRECVDVNRAALAVHSATRGPLLRRQWSQI